MVQKSTPLPFPLDFVQTDPALVVLRLASLLAEADAPNDEETLDLMFEQVEGGFLLDAPPRALWPEILRGLMGPAPGRFLQILRDCGGLAQILPEVSSLYGVPHMSDASTDADLGAHVQNALDAAAKMAAPLAVRFALLTIHVGKADSPREHLPVHYKHIERAAPRITFIADRFIAPLECHSLAMLALVESERVHRASKTRAGPIALMLDRLGAFDRPERYRNMLQICACDFRGHPGRADQPYVKAALLEAAREACAGVDAGAFSDAANPREALDEARATAIARAFRSEKWS